MKRAIRNFFELGLWMGIILGLILVIVVFSVKGCSS